MPNKCQRCGSRLEVTTTSFRSEIGSLKLMIEGITVYVCSRCGQTMIESSDASVLQKISETVTEESQDHVLKSNLATALTLPNILTLSEVAGLLRVSHQTIYNMIRDGRIKGYKVGREWRFLKSEIDAYMMIKKPILSLETGVN